jgi:O-antigen ligase
MANGNPFSGVGLDNFTMNYFFYSDHWDGMNHAVHSTWFGVLAETGYLGLTVFMIMVYKIVKNLYHCVNNLQPLFHQGLCSPVLFCSAQSVLAGLAGFIASGTFLTQGFTWPIYILLALSIAVQQQAKKLMTGNS